jgi:HAD superfamily hydrolase (TIGR01509 family)
MNWIQNFQLFLFDLDGLLVNTEELHYEAYVTMLKRRGYTLEWDFPTYFQIAQQDSKAPEIHIYKEFPQLQKEEPNWSILYAEKKQIVTDLLREKGAPLLPGVHELLTKLAALNKKRCVVTHSPKELVTLLQKHHPILKTITHWITREDYSKPKPDPEGYMKAISQFEAPGDKIIGFEDSVRGMKALMQTKAVAVYINAFDQNNRAHFESLSVPTFESFHRIQL